MVMRVGGARRKTRYKFKKDYKTKGKISHRRYLQALSVGDRVALDAESSVQEGMYFRRFHGKHGIVEKKLGSCYEITIHDKDKEKHLVVHPVHLRKL